MLIDISICTFRRATLFDTLTSIAEQVLPRDVALRVIVADNDDAPLLQDRILAFAEEVGLNLRYVHAPARNISIARNACLDAATGDTLVFIDDDELADPFWIEKLVADWKTSGASVVFGPSIAVYPATAPSWMRRNDFHSNRPVRRHGIVETGYSSNVLVDLSDPRVASCRFDTAFGRTGGEDTDFFFRLHRQGVPMTISHDATVSEPVAPTRLSFVWVLRRRYAQGAIYGSCVAPNDVAARSRVLFGSLVKSSYCVLRAIPATTVAGRFHFWIMRSVFHAGVVSGCIAPPRRQVYGGTA